MRNERSTIPLRVLCVLVRGLDGKGGIDRLFHYLAAEPAYVSGSGIHVRFFASRGDAAGPRWVLEFPFRLLIYIGMLIYHRIDVVHINLSIGASAYRKYLLLSVAQLMGKRVVIHFHGGGFEHMLRAPDRPTRLILQIFRKAHRVVVLGDFWSHLFQDAARLSPDKIDVIRNATSDFAAATAVIPRPPSPALRLVFAGELHPRKGVDVLLPALAALNRRHKDWRCVIAGNGKIAPYRDLAQRLGIAEKITFVGWVRLAEVQRFMLQADVVLLPSRAEGLPICLIEAACAGAVMVATDEGATREVLLDGQNGIIVPLDPDAIGNALFDLAVDPNRRALMQMAARATYLERFTVSTMLSALQSTYQRTANS
jgi:glycosyltransferase involved in cell wall biosynthesis